MEPNQLKSTDTILYFSEQQHEFNAYLEMQVHIYIVCDTNTEKHCLPIAQKRFPSLNRCSIIRLPAGEPCKSQQSFFETINQLIASGANKDDLLLVLGGGALSDLSGFCAHVYKRGMRLAIIPTTLLSMVDAAIGGKNGMNASFVKNVIGTYHFPEAVYIDQVWLNTLAPEEILSGMGEVVKYALLDGKQLFTSFLNGKLHAAILDPEVIATCARLKQSIIQKDPFDANKRRFLNLGHTAGHALESVSQANGIPLSHGTAVAAGLLVSIELSVIYARFDPSLAITIQQCIRNIFRLSFPSYFINESLNYLKYDKKKKGHSLTWILLEEPGKPLASNSIRDESLADVFHTVWGFNP